MDLDAMSLVFECLVLNQHFYSSLILILAGKSSNPVFCMLYSSACKLNKQGDSK